MSSKYDVVKLKVHLSDVHYYILSRFLLSKMLQFCRLPEEAAVRISLEVKKHFVKRDHTVITQAELEAYLQSAMIAFGFSAEHTQLFPVVTQFHTERIPLVLFIAGPLCRGKTTLAHLLSSRVNCSTILNTGVLHDIAASISDLKDVLQLSDNATATAGGAAAADDGDAAVVGAVTAEVEKAVREGKVVIIEGERLRLTWVRRFLDPSYQKTAGAVIFGVLLDSLETPAAVVCADHGEAASNLQAVYTSECVSIMCADAPRGSVDDAAAVPSVYVARCHAAGDNIEVSDYLHNVVIERVVAELRRRGRMPPCEGPG